MDTTTIYNAMDNMSVVTIPDVADAVSIINCVCQCVIAIAAIIAIVVTILQISSKTRIKLKITYTFESIKDASSDETYVEIRFHILNMSMAPVYISESWIQLWKNQNQHIECRITNADSALSLKPGESGTLGGKFFIQSISRSAKLRDQIRLYVVCQIDKKIYCKKSIEYAEFEHEYEKCRKESSQGF